MQKKIFIIFLLTILLIFTFTINLYASTDYSIQKSDYYLLSFSFKEMTNFNLPDVEVGVRYNSPNIYFFILENKNSTYTPYSLYSSSVPFEVVPGEGDYFYLCGSATTRCTTYNKNSNSWSTSSSKFFPRVQINSNTQLIMSSDDIYSGDEILYHAYSKSPLLKTVRGIELKNSVTKEIISILPITLTVFIGLIGVRKAIIFIRKKISNL